MNMKKFLFASVCFLLLMSACAHARPDSIVLVEPQRHEASVESVIGTVIGTVSDILRVLGIRISGWGAFGIMPNNPCGGPNRGLEESPFSLAPAVQTTITNPCQFPTGNWR